MTNRERPILFSAPMIRAILSGSKSQTRRVVKPQPPQHMVAVGRWQDPPGYDAAWWAFVREGAVDVTHPFGGAEIHGAPWRCPYGQPGDRLRVKEAAWMWCERQPNGTTKTGRQKWLYKPMRAAGVRYAADHRTKPNIGIASPDRGNQWGWRLKIGRFLPSWASRITLEVTGVRVERLQDISEADAQAEGCPFANMASGPDPREWYRGLWGEINGPGSWEANPWVWCVSFRRLTP